MTEFDALKELLWMLVTDPGTGPLIGLLGVAAVIDWRTMRIPNWLTVGGMAWGLFYNAAHATSIGAGLMASAGGLATGLALLLPLYVLRVMGAGDVKLMAAVGAVVGVPAVLHAMLWSLVAGGAAAIGYALYLRAFGRMATNVAAIAQSMAFAALVGLRPDPALTGRASVGKLPFGVGIALGTVAFLVARQLGYL
ncbi:A24 family peptidase [Ramlibacter tataouinensis]|uniref:prepilin peptidase n=1 Tax=Ramlibacter tataouinensis TaxID=94132 RepID=UPI0022F3C917|nr:A24 family peptidase [Ramlibacter tataouinensis]WBY02597.1 A24 family peptidase [Ramlibacter tataouinensis]